MKVAETLIVSHETADFDALASAVAAQKLHPGAAILLDAGVDRDVHAYLALHRERFRTVRREDIDMRAVKRLVLVDVRRARRLAVIKPLLDRLESGEPPLEVHAYDHHAASPDDVPADLEVVEPVGSTTTLLLERIVERGIALDAVEATLFLLGIYADTRCLTARFTTARDAAAATRLLEQGARLAVVNRYLYRPLGEEQRRVLRALLDGSCVEVESIHGLRVAFATVQLETARSGLADVTTAAADFLPFDGFVALYAIGDHHVQVVARARSPWLDIGRALEAVGGGGHAAAGSAKLRDQDAGSARRAIVQALLAQAPSPPRVSDAMSSPARTLSRDMPLVEAAAALEGWGFHGAPVVDGDGRLEGVVTLTDIAGAKQRGQLDHPVASCMAQHKLHSATPDMLLDEALELMTREQVGRLPVRRDGSIVGVVTRSDALLLLYA